MSYKQTSGSDQATLKQYYKSCAREALDKKKKKEYEKYMGLIKDIEEKE